MKAQVAMLALAFMSIAEPGHAHEATLPPPIKPEDIGKYCIYASRVYSNGAQICVARGSITLGCDKGEWKVDLTKFGLDCRNETTTGAEHR